MFTGIVETTGTVLSVSEDNSGKVFQIETLWKNPDLQKGDSVSINGACMTVNALQDQGNIFSFYASFKSLEITSLNQLKKGSIVNLERAMSASQRFGGHIVQGHVDGLGKILSRKVVEASQVEEFWIELPESLSKYLVKKGSITVDGISLTVVDRIDKQFQLVLIPETLQKTQAKLWDPGFLVNLEVDVLAKYIENFLEQRLTLQ